MTTWPNWVDLIIVTILLRGCYSGFGRGFLSEVLNLTGAVSITSLAINYWPLFTQWLRPWMWVDPGVAPFLVFITIFLGLMLVVHLGIRRLTDLLKWERLHWSIQGIGLLLGGLRGLWWSGLIVTVLIASGVTYLRESAEQRSVLAPRLAEISHQSLQRIADRFPGAEQRGVVLIPPMKAGHAPDGGKDHKGNPAAP